jgi:hypothetical protein
MAMNVFWDKKIGKWGYQKGELWGRRILANMFPLCLCDPRNQQPSLPPKPLLANLDAALNQRLQYSPSFFASISLPYSLRFHLVPVHPLSPPPSSVAQPKIFLVLGPAMEY